MENSGTTEALKDALSQLIDAYQNMQDQNSNLKQNIANLEGKIESLEAKIDTLEAEKENLEYNSLKNKEIIDSLSSNKEEQNKEIYSMLGKIESLLGATKETINTPVVVTAQNVAQPKVQTTTILEFESGSQNIEQQSLASLTDFIEEMEAPEEQPKPEEADGYFTVGNRGGIDLDRMQSLLGGFGKK